VLSDRASYRVVPHLFAQSTLATRIFLPRRVRCGAGFMRCLSGSQALGRGAVVYGGRSFQGDGCCRSADAGAGVRVEGFALGRRSVQAVAGDGVAGELRTAAGWLVWLALCEDGVSVRESAVLALQRAGQSRPAPVSGGVWAPRAAPDRTYELFVPVLIAVARAAVGAAAGR